MTTNSGEAEGLCVINTVSLYYTEFNTLYAGNADYQSIESEFRFRGGPNQESIIIAHVNIIDDDEEEAEESFNITFTPTQNIVFTNDTITVVICDNDGGNTCYKS